MNIPNSPNSCLIKLQRIYYRSLVDTGAELSLINEKVYKHLKFQPALKKTSIALQSANGSNIKVLGTVDLELKIAGMKITQNFIVVSDLNRNVILGRDFLVKNKVVLYYDLMKMRINGAYVPLENDVHVSSISRLTKTFTMKPRTVYLVKAQVRKSFYFDSESNYSLEPTEKGFLHNQPEIEINPVVVTLTKSQFFPVQITNNSNKHIRLKKGCILGKIKNVNVINTVDTSLKTKNKQTITDQEFVKQIQCDEKHRRDVSKLLFKHKDVFAFSDTDLLHTDLLEAEIDTGDHKPINLKPYRMPLSQRQIVSDSIDEMVKADIIKPSFSPWCFPMVIVDKKPDANGVTPPPRLCVDYRRLNKIVQIQSFPLPLIDDILGNLNGSTYFTSLDLRAGFHQIRLTKESAPKTAFACFKGKYEYNVLPFGLNNSPSYFQMMANKLLSGMESFAIAYIDDILIFTKGDLPNHLEHVEKVLERIRKHYLKLKLSKCSFAQTKTKYLGFVIDQYGVRPDQEKVKAIRSLKPPTNVKQVRSFLGMASWYRRFIPNFAEITEKLVKLTKKYARFQWDGECQKAFDYLKDSLTCVPWLAYPDISKPFILYTDASDRSVGAVLVQENENEDEWIPGIPNEKPIYFLSHKLSDSQIKSYSTSEKEAFAIHYALNKLHYYLHNATFTIKTDHQPLKYLFSAEQKNRRIQAWSLTIGSYNCNIEYIKGTENVCADLLSRSPPKDEDNSVSIPDISDRAFEIAALNSNHFNPKEYINVSTELTQEKENPIPKLEDFNMQEEQKKDTELMTVKTKLESGRAEKTLYKKFIVADGIVYYISQVDDNPILRLYVPSHLQEKVMEQYHHLNGHMSIVKTFDAIKQKYYWPNLYKTLYKKIDECVTCKVRNMQAQKAPLQETNTPPYPFASISLDLSGPYKKSLSGNLYIASFIDNYSGWVEAFPIPDKTAESIVNLLLEEIIPRHSCVLSITTDNGKEFDNHLFKETLEELNIIHIKTTPYHPEGNSKVERSHRTLHDLLAKKMEENIDTWDLHINQVLLALRTNVSRTTNRSPFFLLYNREPVLPLDNLLKPRRKYQGEEFHKIALENQHKTFMSVIKRMKDEKSKQNQEINAERKDKGLEVGDSVYYKNHVKSSKLENNWLTHFIIVEQTSPVSFVIRNQLNGKLVRAHANSLRLSNLEWKVPKSDDKIRKANLSVIPPSDDEDMGNSSSDSDETIIYDPEKYLQKERKILEDSDESQDGIPRFELQKRLRHRDRRLKGNDLNSSVSDDNDDDEEVDMEIGAINQNKKRQLPLKERQTKESKSKTKALLKAIMGML